MISPFVNVPLNTQRLYVMAIAPGGCKVYLPADKSVTENEGLQQGLKKYLQEYLNTLPYTPTSPLQRA